MSNFICVYDYGHRHGNLNMRQLLNPIFFEPVARHPDHKRQRGMRLRARFLRQARELKALGSTWIPELPATCAWEKWFERLGFHSATQKRNAGWSI